MNKFNKILFFVNALFISVVAVAGVAFAWTNPSANPPSGNGALYYSGSNIGIGTASPGYKLDVSGTGRFTSTLYANSNLYVSGFEQISKTAHAPGASEYHLELYSPNSGSSSNEVSLRFHQGSQYYAQIRYRVGGFRFTGGADDTLVPISVGNLFASSAGIGTTSLDSNYKITTSGGGIKAENSSATQPAGYFNNAGGGAAIQVGTGGITLGGVNQTSWPSGQWTTSGTSIYYNTGNVGIGTASPGAKLHVSGGDILIDNAKTLTAKNSAGTVETWMWPRYSDNIMYTNFGSGGWNIRNSSSVNVMFMQNGGNVGIGITSPTQKLDVNGYVKGTGVCIGSDCRTSWPSENYFGTVTGTGNAGYVTKWYNGSQIGNSSIYDNGNVGIGTASPAYKLDVAGVIHASGEISGNGTFVGVSGNASSLNTATGVYGYGGDKGVNGVGGVTGVYGSGSTGVRGIGGGTGVYGSGSSYGVYGQSSNWAGYFSGNINVTGGYYKNGTFIADYVFEPGYGLESIEDHSKFMWENKHLKAIPEPVEMPNTEGKSIELGSFTNGILEELEKAHIYIEQLNGRIKELNTTVSKQQEQINEILEKTQTH